MGDRDLPSNHRIDVAGLVIAGAVNLLALIVAAVLLAPGSPTAGSDPQSRISWVAANTVQWQAGWTFWFAVTGTFAWSYYAITRHLSGARQWRDLAVGAALVAAAIDIVGIVLNLVVLPQLAASTAGSGQETHLLVYTALETLATALVSVVAYGLYSAAGLLLVPVLFATAVYPRWLAWLGAVEWSLSAIVTLLLALTTPLIATGPFLLSVLLYVTWVWGSARWIARLNN